MSSTEETSDIENLITKIGEIDINNSHNFINIKPDIKQELNPNITDIPSTSRGPFAREPPLKRRFTTPTDSFYTRNPTGYAGLSSLPNDNYTPLKKMRNENINPFGIFLDLDCVSNVEEAIDKWETSLRIAVEINKMDFEITKRFLEKTLVNSASRFWQNMTEATKNVIFLADSPSQLITRAAEAFQLEFHGEGRLIKDPTMIMKYVIALQRLQLCDMCEIEKYICVFQDFYYHIYHQTDNSDSYLPLFFSKIPNPWGQKLIETYNPMTTDTLGKRIAHLRDKLSSWCGDAILAKATKGLRKRISLCSDTPKMPLMIGCDSQYYYEKIKRKYKKRK
ncbi:hypothetical protein ACOSQ4_014067 [Xanthoceras sorbifolium]